MKKLSALFFFIFSMLLLQGQNIPYGNNPQAGKYLQVGDAKIYYEIYGEGKPLLLLHGDFYGYISEFSGYIPILSKHFKVIAVAKRGHGKSELGNQPFSQKLFAEDAMAVLRHETTDTAAVVGFSGGAITALYIAANYPGSVNKAVGLAGGISNKGLRPDRVSNVQKLNYQEMEKNAAGFFENRKKLMPQPERFEELLNKFKVSWLSDVVIDEEKAKAIRCPVLIVGGDRDNYSTIDRYVNAYLTIPGAQLAIIPNCDHVCLVRRPEMFESVVMPFLLGK